jgi:putative phage-type endonuclease
MTEQGTDEWIKERLGKVTASRIADLTATTKSGWGASRQNYMAELLCERLTGERAGSRFVSQEMTWGKEKEPEARSLYEIMNDVKIEQVGFKHHPMIPMSGASPDGMVGDDGLIETKCPLTNQHIDTLLDKAVPGKYIKQMQWQMACTGRQWCDFVSYDPRLPHHMRLFVTRIPRDQTVISSLESDVKIFLAQLDEKIKDLNEKYPAEA